MNTEQKLVYSADTKVDTQFENIFELILELFFLNMRDLKNCSAYMVPLARSLVNMLSLWVVTLLAAVEVKKSFISFYFHLHLLSVEFYILKAILKFSERTG